ncbi:MAG: response regulator transcription factor [Cyclobacteriaceae bacterium]|nr:response regulator transcription factor [Cyclobacteriaceae bacterium]MCK5209824.1 response regulator transcription factor [Cyclobacteriaceae bacterium]
MILNCIVVDDDEMSRKVVVHFIEKTNFLQLTKEFDNAIDATHYLDEEHVDIIFLDIQMPEMSGMDFINALEKDIEIILITSEQKYAVEAFEKKVTDYLVKPIEYSRFLQSAQKAHTNVEIKRATTVERKECYVRTEAKIVRIPYEKILFVEALADYVIIQTEAKKHIVHFTMKGIANRLPDDEFVRTHRSYIVNLDKIEALEDNSLLIGEKYIPIGASYKDALLNRLNFL